jgi:DNA-binding beta-propeller fold protein YncE
VIGAGLVGCIDPPDLSPSDDPDDADDADDLPVSPTRDAGTPRDATTGVRLDSGTFAVPRDGGPIPTKGFPRPFPGRLDQLLSAASTPPPISGGTLAVSSDGMKVVAADPDRDNIYVVDPETVQVQTITLEKGSEPGRVVLDGKSRAHVALRNKQSIVSIDLRTSKVLLQTNVCPNPRGMAYDRERGAVLVACASGELVALSADTHAELSRVFVDRDLRDVVVTRTAAEARAMATQHSSVRLRRAT